MKWLCGGALSNAPLTTLQVDSEQVLRRPIETTAVTGKVGPGTDMSGYATYQELPDTC
jgi:hypothetical protein